MKGEVKWFDDKKKYGFITAEDGRDYFVHFTAIVSEGYKTLKRREQVEFEAVEDGDRRRADKVVLKSFRRPAEPRAGV